MFEEREIVGMYLTRTVAELSELVRRGLLLAGSAPSDVLLVKGEPGPAELAGEALLSGRDGVALSRALSTLGYADDAWAALASARRAADGSWVPVGPDDLSFAVEVFDPELIVALDPAAAVSLAEAWALEAPLVPGEPRRVLGRRVLALGGFERALDDPAQKRVMWARLKRVPPLGAPM